MNTLRKGVLLGGLAACMLVAAPPSRADNLIDHRLSKDTGGIYSLQDAVPIGLGLLSGGCALWEGTDDRLGKTCWESAESGLEGVAAAKLLQVLIRRQAPSETDDPNHWFSPHTQGSFPSTHVTFTTAVVTPVIAHYFQDDPWVAALALLPAYEMVARVKAQEHWQTDVLAGAVLGGGIGALESYRDSPWAFYLMPGGGFIGFKKSF
jgi:undecaprenyl-diphosphatase